MDNSIYWLITLWVQEKDFKTSTNKWIFETWSTTNIHEVADLAMTYIQNHMPYERFKIIWIEDLRVLWEISLRKKFK